MFVMSDKWKKRLLAVALLVFSASSVYLFGNSIEAIYTHYRAMFGPVFWLFVLLSVVLLSSVGQIVFGCYEEEPSTAGVKFVEAAGPSVGLLGTVLALMNGFGSLNLSGENLDAAINSIVHTIAVSLSTTAFGLILSLLAWAFRSCLLPLLVRKRVKHQKPQVEPSAVAVEQNDEDETEEVAIVGKEPCHAETA